MGNEKLNWFQIYLYGKRQYVIRKLRRELTEPLGGRTLYDRTAGVVLRAVTGTLEDSR
jgi:hypothetical protein